MTIKETNLGFARMNKARLADMKRRAMFVKRLLTKAKNNSKAVTKYMNDHDRAVYEKGAVMMAETLGPLLHLDFHSKDDPLLCVYSSVRMARMVLEHIDI